MQKSCKILCLWCLWLITSLPAKADVSPRYFDVYNASTGLSDNSAQTIRCTKTGRLVITTIGQINFFDGHQFTYIDPTNENIYPLDSYQGNYHLYFDRFHHLWLKNNHSVTCVELATERFTNSIKNIFSEFGVNETVTDLFVDNDGIPFLLTGDGLYSVGTKRTYQIRTNQNLQDLETYKDKYLLMFYENGEVDVVELSTGNIVYVSKSYGPSEYSKYDQSSIIYEDGSTYYQIRNGSKGAILQCFDIGKWEWRKLLTTPYHMNNLDMRDSILYIPCEYGYWTYNISDNKVTHYEELMLMDGRLLNTNLNTLTFDKQGGMWIGTETWGLLYSRPHNVPFSVYSWNDKEALEYARMMDHLPDNRHYRDKAANCVYKDSQGRIWVGTSTGLHLYKNASEKLPQVFTRRDGLLNNVIHSVVEDHLHHIWVGTSYGLSCLIFKDDGTFDHMLSYNSYDRIPNESFINGRAMCLSDGRVVFQMLDHVLAFDPKEMQTLTGTYYKIYPKLVKLLVNGNEVRTGEPLDGHIILTRALSRTKEINVDYNMNSLSLIFSSLNYFRPQQTYYRIRIIGLDDSWRTLTPYNSQGQVDDRGQLHLSLPALKPGTYSIQLQTSMTLSDWTTEPYEWIVNVNEPWWRTTGVFILLALLLLALFLVNVWFYVRNTNMKTRRSSEEQGIIRRIKQLADYSHASSQRELIAPSLEEITSIHNDTNSASPEFIETMMKIIEVVQQKKTSQLSMKMLSNIAGMDLQSFYKLISSNIYKDPQVVIRRVAIQDAEKLLRTTNMDIAEITEACSFATPNYFIATFYREYHQLPEDYRRQHRSF